MGRKNPTKDRYSLTKMIVGFGRSLNYLGLVSAVIFFCFSVLPSLLPRPWIYQGLISGISIAVGYCFGVMLSSALRWTLEYEPPQPIKQWAWKLLIYTGPITFIIYLYLGSVWQREVHLLVGLTNGTHRYLFRVLVVTTLVSFLLLLMGRLIMRLNRLIIHNLDKVLPRRASIGLGCLVVAIALWWVLSGVFFNFFVTQANKKHSIRNNSTPKGVLRPADNFRSGSKESLVSWDSLGFQGKKFVASGPTKQELETFTGQTPKNPIRAYVGLNSADNATDRANLAVAELKRTNAFSRKILILATPTGTGWLEPQSVDTIEYLYNGDSAIVAQQYSYLPSWISFLVDKENARSAGRALYDAVYAEWSKLPKDSRPKLIIYGLSLGSFGSQSAFSGVNDIKLSVDGALFVGTPSDTELWREITHQRDAGSPERLPTYKNGKTVRFASNKSDIDKNQEVWEYPRVLYLQHASDPVVWFDFDLVYSKPDWLNEQRGSDVSPTMRWYPFVTFIQVGIDQFFGVTMPNGRGHNYPDSIVNAWVSVTNPEEWSESKTLKLQQIINNYKK